MKSFINYIVESRTQKSYDLTNISEKDLKNFLKKEAEAVGASIVRGAFQCSDGSAPFDNPYAVLLATVSNLSVEELKSKIKQEEKSNRGEISKFKINVYSKFLSAKENKKSDADDADKIVKEPIDDTNAEITPEIKELLSNSTKLKKFVLNIVKKYDCDIKRGILVYTGTEGYDFGDYDIIRKVKGLLKYSTNLLKTSVEQVYGMDDNSKRVVEILTEIKTAIIKLKTEFISEIEEKFSKLPKSSGIKFMRISINNYFVVEVKENGMVPFVNKQSIKEIAQKILQDYKLDWDIKVSSQMRNEDSYDIGFKIR